MHTILYDQILSALVVLADVSGFWTSKFKVCLHMVFGAIN